MIEGMNQEENFSSNVLNRKGWGEVNAGKTEEETVVAKVGDVSLNKSSGSLAGDKKGSSRIWI